MAMKFWDDLTWEQRWKWYDEHPYKPNSARAIRCRSGLWHRSPDSRLTKPTKGFIKHQKRLDRDQPGWYWHRSDLRTQQRAAHKLERHKGQAEVEQQLDELDNEFLYEIGDLFTNVFELMDKLFDGVCPDQMPETKPLIHHMEIPMSLFDLLNRVKEQPPAAKELIVDACKATELFTEDELEEHARKTGDCPFPGCLGSNGSHSPGCINRNPGDPLPKSTTIFIIDEMKDLLQPQFEAPTRWYYTHEGD